MALPASEAAASSSSLSSSLSSKDNAKTIDNKVTIIYDDYCFVLETEFVENNSAEIPTVSQRWRCNGRNDLSSDPTAVDCPAKLLTNSAGDVISMIGQHSHDVPKSLHSNQTSKEPEISSTEPLTKEISSLSKQQSSKTSVQTTKILPTLNSMRKLIERTRRSRSKEPFVPCKMSELTKIPLEYRYIVNAIDIDMEDFLFYDSADDSSSSSEKDQKQSGVEEESTEERFLIFSTKQYLDILQECFIWFSDSSYDQKPPLFEQLYILFGVHSKQFVPLVFVLMSHKTASIYRKLFRQLKQLRPGLNPTILMSNFAEPVENENFILEFPHATQFGSFFHHYQRLLNKLKTMPEIYKKFTDDLQYQIKIKMICALAYVPVDCVGWALEMLIADPLYNDVELHLINYCSEDWINGTMITRIERKPPEYPPALWNCFETGKLLHSTANNEVNNWHHRINTLLKLNHTSIWKFISALKREVPGLNKLLCKPPITKEKKKPNRQFCQLIKSWDQESIKPGFNVVQYLQQISANF